jgi:hypothetical protein
MNIRILESAHEDLLRGYWFYEAQQIGLGDYFIESIYSDIESLNIHAGIHQVYFNKYYRLLTKKFPYAIYYRIDKSTILIHAILDTRQNPYKAMEILDY